MKIDVQAIFKGQNNSAGYRFGEIHNLLFGLDSHGGQDIIEIEEVKTGFGTGLVRIRKDSYCTYQSLNSFLNIFWIRNYAAIPVPCLCTGLTGIATPLSPIEGSGIKTI